MRQDEYLEHDAVGLASLIADGQVTAREVLEAAIERADAVNPTINAINVPMYTQARRHAAANPPAGPLSGVPFLIKDLRQDYAGLPTSQGNAALRHAPVLQHAEVVRRWLDAGLVIFGKTNVPEFGAKSVTEPTTFGITRNPWNLSHTPGGSSGGSAAAVAAGVVPAAGASDGGGSIRIPAAWTGLFGLKPGRGRVPDGPNAGEILHGASVNGVLTRTVRDSAALLDVMAGHERTGAVPIQMPSRPYREEVGRDPGRLRIAFTDRTPVGHRPIHPEAAAAVRNAANLLAGLGHDVTQDEPSYDGAQFAEDFFVLWYARIAAAVATVKELTGCGDEAFEPDTLVMAAVGRSRSAAEYARCQDRWHDYSRKLADFHARFDLLLTPTVAVPPPKIGTLGLSPSRERAVRMALQTHTARLLTPLAFRPILRLSTRYLAMTPFTPLANVTGRPAMSVPLHWTGSGLPLGVQFVAPPGGEDVLLRLAGQLEATQPWAQRRPPEPAGPPSSTTTPTHTFPASASSTWSIEAMAAASSGPCARSPSFKERRTWDSPGGHCSERITTSAVTECQETWTGFFAPTQDGWRSSEQYSRAGDSQVQSAPGRGYCRPAPPRNWRPTTPTRFAPYPPSTALTLPMRRPFWPLGRHWLILRATAKARTALRRLVSRRE